MGQRYGLRPLPTAIDVTEFEILLNELENVLGEDMSIEYTVKAKEGGEPVVYRMANILRESFKLDSNSIPNNYHILPVSRLVADFNSSVPEVKKRASVFWDVTKNKMLALLRKAADSAHRNQLLSRVVRDRFFDSITEDEINNGIFKDAAERANECALCFIREIDNLEEHLSDSKAWRFTDLKTTPEGKMTAELDEEAQALLHELKYVKIPAVLNPDTNIIKFNVRWVNNQIDASILDSYLKEFGESFYTQVVRLIDQAKQAEKLSPSAMLLSTGLNNPLASTPLLAGAEAAKLPAMTKELNDLIVEISLHALEWAETTGKFFGRDELMLKIRNFYLGESTLPFVVAGESGCGKTNVMAIAHQQVVQKTLQSKITSKNK